jgi:hypothetical protein
MKGYKMNEIIVGLKNSQGIVELQVIARDTSEAIQVVEKSEYAGEVVYAFGTDFTSRSNACEY